MVQAHQTSTGIPVEGAISQRMRLCGKKPFTLDTRIYYKDIKTLTDLRFYKTTLQKETSLIVIPEIDLKLSFTKQKKHRYASGFVFKLSVHNITNQNYMDMYRA